MTKDMLLVLILLVINITTFCLYGLDKYKARRDLWRIPEASLLSFAAIGGSIGALAGMYIFRHKTKKVKFVIGVPALLILHAVSLLYYIS